MKLDNLQKCLYFCPVKQKYINNWEYYNVDKKLLSELFQDLVMKTSVLGALLEIILRKPDSVYCWWWHRSFWVILVSKLMGINVVCTGAIHMYDESGGIDWYKRNLLARLFIKLSLRICSSNLFISNSQFRQITSHLKVSNPAVVKSSLSFDWDENRLGSRSNEILKNENIDLSKIFISNVTWLTKSQIIRKNLINIIDGVIISKEIYDIDIEMTIIGSDGGAKEYLSSYLRKKGCEKYIFIKSALEKLEKDLILGNSDIYIQPTYYEGFGNAVLEAMSFGIPTIVSCNTAQPEVVGEAGYIIPEIDKNYIAKTLVEFRKLNLKERRNLINKVSNRVQENFSISSRKEAIKPFF